MISLLFGLLFVKIASTTSHLHPFQTKPNVEFGKRADDNYPEPAADGQIELADGTKCTTGVTDTVCREKKASEVFSIDTRMATKMIFF